MKKVFLIISLLAIAISLAIFVNEIIIKGRKEKVATKVEEEPQSCQVTRLANDFLWGVQAGLFALHNLNQPYNPEITKRKIQVFCQLGVNLVRANLELNKSDSPFLLTPIEEANDDYINQLSEKNFAILLVLDPDIPSTIGRADYENEGYKLATYAAKRYQGKVQYYQIANEISGTIIKPPDFNGEVFDGENGIKYSTERYQATLGWIKGMVRGIRENDPNGKIVLSGHWILYDIFQKLISDGADFDILGWSWYSPDGLDVTKREYNYGDYFNLAEKLAQYKKPLWIVESNSDHGSYFDGKISPRKGEEEQANFIRKFTSNLFNSGYFKAMIVFTLFDDPIATQQKHPQDAHWGLIEVKTGSNGQEIVRYKRAFNEYKNVIQTTLSKSSSAQYNQSPNQTSSAPSP